MQTVYTKPNDFQVNFCYICLAKKENVSKSYKSFLFRLFIIKLQLSYDLNLEKQESKLIYKPRFNQTKLNSYLF